jgi:hypothetical protein
MHPLPIPHLFVMRALPPCSSVSLDYHPHLFYYIPDVQLCRECAISEAKFPSLSVCVRESTEP